MTQGGNDCWKRFKMGALMGGSVGACIGILFGTASVLKYGHGGNGFLRTVGKVVVQSGASFGLFMGIGAFIRCDEGESLRRHHPIVKSYLIQQ